MVNKHTPNLVYMGVNLDKTLELQRAHTQTEVQNIRSEQYIFEAIKYKTGSQAISHQNNSSCTLRRNMRLNTRKQTLSSSK